MAAKAVSDDAGVVEDRWYPGIGIMAIVALVTRYDVVECFPGRLQAVVARQAATSDRRMIHINHGVPGCGGMAVGTLTRRLDMIGGF